LIPCLSLPLFPAEGNFHLIATDIPVSGGLQDGVKLNDSVFGPVETQQSFQAALRSCLWAAFTPTLPEKTSKIIYAELESISILFPFRET
jgi:hypothetical protein